MKADRVLVLSVTMNKTVKNINSLVLHGMKGKFSNCKITYQGKLVHCCIWYVFKSEMQEHNIISKALKQFNSLMMKYEGVANTQVQIEHI